MAFFTRKKPAPARNATQAPQPSGRAAQRDPAFERRVQEIGAEFLAKARAADAGAFAGSLSVFKDKLMDWAMRDEAFRVQLFRFVDCFPTLRTNEAIFGHLSDYLSQPGVKAPPGFELGMAAGGLAKGLMAKTMAGQIEGMASKFIAGTDAASALPSLERMWKHGMCFSVDLLGEACVSDEEARLYREKYLDLVENLPKRVAAWPAKPVLESDHLGPVARTNVSIKVSSLSARVDPIDTEGSIRSLMAEIRPILEAAKRNGVLVNFDMEQFALKDLTIELFKRCCEAVDFEAGLAMQAYLRSAPDDARSVVEWAKRTGRVVTVRLVKGAYWDYETIHAEQQGWPVPVWSRKCDTDACFERVAQNLIEHTPRKRGEGGVKLALGSHNARSIAAALATLEKCGLPKSAIELQMLHGMGDQLKVAAMGMG
ncbi:MAG: proline dehydrogenase family protein, partial [Planctomycetota bacterium]